VGTQSHLAVAVADFKIRVMIFAMRNPRDRIDECHAVMKIGEPIILADRELSRFQFPSRQQLQECFAGIDRQLRIRIFLRRTVHRQQVIDSHGGS
jgi:hypothetical protein